MRPVFADFVIGMLATFGSSISLIFAVDSLRLTEHTIYKLIGLGMYL